MTRKLLIALFLTLIIVIFAVQNAEPVTINLFFWSFSISLAIIMVVCIFCGALVGSLFSIVSMSRKNAKKEALSEAARKTETRKTETPKTEIPKTDTPKTETNA